jgi:hypothetical protein
MLEGFFSLLYDFLPLCSDFPVWYLRDALTDGINQLSSVFPNSYLESLLHHIVPVGVSYKREEFV